ncbi:MAG TPA: hypothetical protein VFX79_02820 [Candidatus Saccharimonadales bacterium]|nr:hypothetical protein [Candidatus Saccharimonadales bacterium]
MEILIIKSLQLFAASNCGGDFFGLPAWHKYIKTEQGVSQCVPQINSLNDFWLIGLAVIELLVRMALYIGIAFVVYAGIKYSESRGNVDKATSAKNTLIDAITGVIIAMVAVAILSFVGSRFI